MRKIIIILIGILLLLGAILYANFLRNNKKVAKQEVAKVEKTAFVQRVENKTIPIVITANGNLKAKNKIELYAEVQGVLKFSNKEFKEGNVFKKGETLLQLNAEEYYASIQAQRSSLQNLIVSMMPDMRLDYPESYKNWNSYLIEFDVNSSIKELPEPLSDQEKYFVTAKNIYNTYYSIKNLETRLDKYRIRAPFKGVITETMVTQGTLVRSGQKLGEFIDTSEYELEIAVNAAYANRIVTGSKVTVENLTKTQSWIGEVTRVNGKIETTSQTIQAFIKLKGTQLKEGMFLQAALLAKEEPNAIEIDRKLLIENEAVYIVKNRQLDLVKVTPIYFTEKTVIIKGLANGANMVSKPIIGAYEGMSVNVIEEK